VIDLHIHTNASADGQHSPDEIVSMAAELGLSAIAFADHNTIGSVAEGAALCADAGIDFINSIELNTDHLGMDLHLLGYGFDLLDLKFTVWIDRLKKQAMKRARAWADKMNELGLRLDFERVQKLSGESLPTGSSFLRAIAEHPENLHHPLAEPYLPGGIKSQNPYVLFYFEVMAEGPAKVDAKLLTTIEAIETLSGFGAIPVLAHPNNLEASTIDPLVKSGLRGIEAISSYHDDPTTARHIEYAKSRKLIMTAGSDFHGVTFKKDVKLGGISGNDRAIYERLIEALAISDGSSDR
jgi:3',5'-nucleoside bisphosphate phosphatase